MSFNVVLVHPLIPQNTGNIARLTAATNCMLHLIQPLGFELSDRYVKRAGLDYWSEVKLQTHAGWEQFLDSEGIRESGRLWFFSKKAQSPYHQAAYQAGDYLVYGNENEGLPPEIHERYTAQRLRIPMDNEKVRSLNLSNSVALSLFEARRQCGLLG